MIITRDGFSILTLSEVETLLEVGNFPELITHTEGQLSEDKTQIYLKGVYEESIKTFESVTQLQEYIYANGWTKPSESVET